MTTIENPIVSNFVKLLSDAKSSCTKDFANQLQTVGQQLIDALARSEKIVDCDDGSFVTLDSFTGGASTSGVFGELTLRFHAPDGTSKIREYKALGDAHAESI